MTINQILRKTTIRKKKYKKKRTKALGGFPQKSGICYAIVREKPKKPNSAMRKVLKISYYVRNKVREFRNKKKKIIIEKKRTRVQAYGEIPLNHFIKYQKVMFRGGRVRDLPGIRYRVVYGKFDLKPYYGNKPRTSKRSKFSLKNLENYRKSF